METFRAVKIIHSISDRLDFLFLAEFFHFCGLYVGEEILGSGDFDPVQELEERCFDAFICVSNGHEFYQSLQYEESDSKFRRTEERFIFWGRVRHKAIQTGKDRKKKIGELRERQQINLLMECVRRIIQALHLPMEVDSWKMLIEIYVNNRLMLHSSSLQYYPKRSSFAVKAAGEGMMMAYRQLAEQDQSFDFATGDYAHYAKIWCAIKVNEAYEYQNMALYFEPQKLAENCERLAAANPDFSNAYVLEGLCYENSIDRAIEAISAFQRALRMEKTKCYSASIYYWIGKRFEAYESGQEEAEKSYLLAYNRRRKFRNIYKAAMYANSHGQYEQAEKYYMEIINALKDKKERHMQDPLELEYAFKAYHHMCVIFYEHCDDVTVKYRKIILYAQKAIEIVDNEIDISVMYNELYGNNEAEAYRKISRERMSLKGIYQILSLTYSELHEDELARKYRDKI